MTIEEGKSGAARAWGQAPGGWEEDVWDFVQQAWKRLHLPATVRREDPITRLLYGELYSMVNEPGDTFWWVEQQEENWDALGEIEGRMDLTFRAPGPKPRERCYTVECKRLNLPPAKGEKLVRSNAGQYVANGMVRFFNGQYAVAMPCGGMVGYVMDGDLATARSVVEKEMKKARPPIVFDGPPTFHACAFLPTVPSGGITKHTRQGDLFVLQHLFLSVPEITQ